MIWSDLRVAGQDVLSVSVFGRDVESAILHWLQAEGILNEDAQRRHTVVKHAVVDVVVGMIVFDVPLEIDTRNQARIAREWGSSHFLSFVDRLYEQGFLDKAPVTGNSCKLININLLTENIQVSLEHLLEGYKQNA